MSKRLLPALLVAASLAAAGCAGRGEANTRASSQNDREEQLLEFAQCMRDHGVDIPDPKMAENGGLMIERPHNTSGKPTDAEHEKMEAARKACEKYMPFQELTPEQRAKMQDDALEFAQCMRGKGYDVPDPDFSKPEVRTSKGRGRRQAFFGSGKLDPDDPKTRAAIESCQQGSFGGKGGPGIGFHVERAG